MNAVRSPPCHDWTPRVTAATLALHGIRCKCARHIASPSIARPQKRTQAQQLTTGVRCSSAARCHAFTAAPSRDGEQSGVHPTTHTHTHAPHRRRKHARRTHAHSTHALTRHAPNGSHLNAFVPQVWRERAHSPRIGAAPALLVALPLCARTPLPTGRRGDARNTDTTS